MVDFEYLERGIYGLANAHRAGTMAGHLGAAVIAGYFFGEDQGQLPEPVFEGIQRELDRVIKGEEAIWFNAKKAGVTPAELFAPIEPTAPQSPTTAPQSQTSSGADATQRNTPMSRDSSSPRALDAIANVLAGNMDVTRQSGHNVIFASIAMRALHEHAEFARPEIIDGVRRLTIGFNDAHAGRGYYGRERGWLNGNQVPLADDTAFPAYTDIEHMVRTTLQELIDTAAQRRQGFGGLWHIINHAAAITELRTHGYADLAQRALPAHHQHIQLWRTLPDVESELGPVVKSGHDPRDPAYWHGRLKRDEARLTHRIKTLYGFFTLLRHLDDEPLRQRAESALRYLMA